MAFTSSALCPGVMMISNPSSVLICSQLFPDLLPTPSPGFKPNCQHSVTVHHLYVPSHWASLCLLLPGWDCLPVWAILSLCSCQQVFASYCLHSQGCIVSFLWSCAQEITPHSRWPYACLSTSSSPIDSWPHTVFHHPPGWLLWCAALRGACSAWHSTPVLNLQDLLVTWCSNQCHLTLLLYSLVQE